MRCSLAPSIALASFAALAACSGGDPVGRAESGDAGASEVADASAAEVEVDAALEDSREAGPDARPRDAAPRADGGELEDAGESPGGGLFVAVGYAGRRAVSADGLDWLHDLQEPGPGGDDDQLFRDVAYGDGVFVAVGGSMIGRIMWTRDGETWTEVSDDQNWLGAVAYGNGIFLAAGSGGRHLRSTNGMTWTDRARAAGGSFRGLAFGGGRFVAVGDAGRRISTADGVTFSGDTGGGSNLTAVAHGGGRFVAVGDGGRRVVSLDGSSWILDTSGGAPLRGVTHGLGKFVAVGQGRTTISADGVSWEEHTGPELNSVTFGDGIFVATGWRDRRYRSTDGVSWQERASDDRATFVAVAHGRRR